MLETDRNYSVEICARPLGAKDTRFLCTNLSRCLDRGVFLAAPSCHPCFWYLKKVCSLWEILGGGQRSSLSIFHCPIVVRCSNWTPCDGYIKPAMRPKVRSFSTYSHILELLAVPQYPQNFGFDIRPLTIIDHLPCCTQASTTIRQTFSSRSLPPTSIENAFTHLVLPRMQRNHQHPR